MNTLIRRLAAGLALPLVIGAPVVLLAEPAHAAGPTDIAIQLPAHAVYGQEVRAVATVTEEGGGNAVSAGAVQFSYQPTGCSCEPVPIGGAVAVSASGTALSPVLQTNDLTPFEVNTDDAPYQFLAEYVPDATHDPSSVFGFMNIDKAGSSLAVLPGPTSIVADMSGQLPGGVQANSLKPTGTVTFTVAGAPVGTASVGADGRATLSYVVPPGATRTVAASYAGDVRYTASTDAATRVDPEITARVLGKFPKSKSGWYRTPVDILFTCRPHGSELVADCPLEVTLKKSGADQSVTQSVYAVDGGVATVVVDGINIDRDKPEISIVNGKCKATDELSGVKSCHLRTTANDKVIIAIALDKAGNRAIKRVVVD